MTKRAAMASVIATYSPEDMFHIISNGQRHKRSNGRTTPYIKFYAAGLSKPIKIHNSRFKCIMRQSYCACCMASLYEVQIVRHKGQTMVKFGLRNTYDHLVEATVDHIVPRSKGGENTLDNYQTLCKGCNHLKNDDEISNQELRFKRYQLKMDMQLEIERM